MADTSRWDKIQARFNELTGQLAGSVDPRERHKLQKEHSYLNSILTKNQEILRLDEVIQKSHAEAAAADSEMQSLYEEEVHELEERRNILRNELDSLMYPPDERDKRPAFIEIRAGAGGQEAALFAADLVKMYSNYALSKGWVASIVDSHQTDLKGFREVVLDIDGKGAYGALKFESGTHRVQRVPETETSGRIHTSTATVAVFPSVCQDEEVAIDPQQLRIDVFRAGGAGGQHVNKTESAVRITHIPTGIVVSCQDDRSQHKNKATAMKVLQARLVSAQHEQEEAQRGAERKKMVGSGMRAEKVRTYNFPQNRVTDHQADITLKNLDIVMAGKLDEIIEALKQKEQTARHSEPLYTP